jgi:hypothetical protein
VYFVELKAPGEKQSPIQRYVMQQLRDHGASCVVIDDKAGVIQFTGAM